MLQSQPIPAVTGREAGMHPGKVTSPSQDTQDMTWTLYFKLKHAGQRWVTAVTCRYK